MLIHPVSDLHVDKEGNRYKRRALLDRDVVVLFLGDLGEPVTAYMGALREQHPDNRIIALGGNHDSYSHGELLKKPWLKTTWEAEREKAPKVAAGFDITWLDGGYGNGEVIVEGVRVLGATGWTGFDARPPWLSMAEAQRIAAGPSGMQDYRKIKVGAGRSRDMLQPKDTIADFRRAVRWIETSLATPFDGETILATHHPLTLQSLLDPGKPSSDLDWCYASACEYLFHNPGDPVVSGRELSPNHVPPTTYFHGHVHRQQDYQLGETRVIANPRGYPCGNIWIEGGPRENPAFDEDLVIEVGMPLVPQMGM